MGKMVDQPQVRKWFELACSRSVITTARVDCTFMVYDVNGPGPVMQQIEMPDDSDEEAEAKPVKKVNKTEVAQKMMQAKQQRLDKLKELSKQIKYLANQAEEKD
jgi:hypothetical protein